MEIPVLLEPLPDGGFQAQSADPLGFDGPGRHTRCRLAASARSHRDPHGFRSHVDVHRSPGPEVRTYPGAGMYKDDPLFDRWREAIEAYRQEVEDDPNR